MDKKESETLEFKKSTSELKEAIKSIVSILNKHGKGELYFGIKNNGEIIGQSVSERTIREISKSISDHIEPKIFPKINEVVLENKKCVHVEFSGDDKPYYAYGRPYIRVGDEDRQLSAKKLEAMIIEKNKGVLKFDSGICKDAKLSDINPERLKWFLKESKKQRGFKIVEDAPIKEILMKLKLMKEGKITNACVLLFGKDPQDFFIQSEVKCIRFKGNKPVKPYIDFQTISGDVIDIVNKVEDFILRNIKKSIWVAPGKIEREERYEYPDVAMREAIVNAIVHRDYSSQSKVQIRIFDDYIEIWNPGSLPEGWTIEKLKQKHESIPKNPLLFKQLFLIKYVEDVGGGTLDMMNECRKWGLPEPEFEFTGTSLVVSFRKHKITGEILETLNERQKKAIEYLKEHKKISRSEYADLCNCSIRTAFNDIQDLSDKKLVKQKGRGRSVYYELL